MEKLGVTGFRRLLLSASSAQNRRQLSKVSDGDGYHSLYQATYKDHAVKTGLTHVDERGEAVMVDVGDKPQTVRTARARAVIRVGRRARQLIHTNQIQKGDVMTVAQIGGIMGAKRTSELIPLCHPIPLTKVDVRVSLDEGSDDTLTAECEAKCLGHTGVEMEALTGASVAALTIYDMCKAVNKHIKIESVHLIYKSGGQSGDITEAQNE